MDNTFILYSPQTETKIKDELCKIVNGLSTFYAESDYDKMIKQLKTDIKSSLIGLDNDSITSTTTDKFMNRITNMTDINSIMVELKNEITALITVNSSGYFELVKFKALSKFYQSFVNNIIGTKDEYDSDDITIDKINELEPDIEYIKILDKIGATMNYYFVIVDSEDFDIESLLNPDCTPYYSIFSEIDAMFKKHNKKLNGIFDKNNSCLRLFNVILTSEQSKQRSTSSNTLMKTNFMKISCKNPDEQCNVGFKPFYYSRLKDKSGGSIRKLNKNLERLNNACSNSKGDNDFCCDPNDSIPVDDPVLKQKFRWISTDKTCRSTDNIHVCNKENVNECDVNRVWKKPDSYHLCKLMGQKDDTIIGEKSFSSSELEPDCFENKCNNYSKYIDLNNDVSRNDLVTKHFYLISEVKKDNMDYIKQYYDDPKNNVNEKLKYGYAGNTIFHTVAYYKAHKCSVYLTTLNYDYTIINKDMNNVLHIACLKGNYDFVDRIIKNGGGLIECQNKYGDTVLHCAVRSGSYNSLNILLDNGAGGSINVTNKLGETPLHTAVITKKKNIKIVELLVENGANIHNMNRNDETILKSLSNEDKTVAREEIRTFLQKVYYFKYGKEEYNSLLNEYPEIRPFTLDTEIDETMKLNFKKYEDNVNYKDMITYDDDLKNINLYVDKDTRGIKGGVNEKYFEYFDGEIGKQSNMYNPNSILYFKYIIFSIIFVVLIFFVKKRT